jgi:hypothetical protein
MSGRMPQTRLAGSKPAWTSVEIDIAMRSALGQNTLFASAKYMHPFSRVWVADR